MAKSLVDLTSTACGRSGPTPRWCSCARRRTRLPSRVRNLRVEFHPTAWPFMNLVPTGDVLVPPGAHDRDRQPARGRWGSV